MSSTIDVLERTRALAPGIAKRSEEIEAERTLPRDIVDDLIDAGCFRITAPQSHGGLELPLRRVLEIIEEVAHADGAAGWCVNIAVDGAVFLTGLSPEGYEQIYAGGPDVILAGSGAPRGKAEVVEGGYRASGRWPFASGCRHADWIMGLCLVTKDGDPVVVDGAPTVRVVFVPQADVQILDTWHTVGLRGTGSADVAFEDVFVPTHMAIEFPSSPCVHGPLYDMPYFAHSPLRTASVALGIARAALDDAVELGVHKRPTMNPSVRSADQPLFKFDLGQADAAMRGAHDALYAEADRLWKAAVEGEVIGDLAVARAQATAAWVTTTCAAVVDEAYRAGGAQALYDGSSLQRRMRDMHVVTQHIAVRRESFIQAGDVLLGGALALPFK